MWNLTAKEKQLIKRKLPVADTRDTEVFTSQVARMRAIDERIQGWDCGSVGKH